ncbi:MAG: 50S ribosomal protein L28 [Candidatus Komeilibacteria bacterium]|nr:50S ribosomal protein L28 [Candidatus Komeilibacteria bacterium]
MSNTCQLCSRGSSSGATRSHSRIQSKRRVFINLQAKTVDGTKMKVCTKCIKNMSK